MQYAQSSISREEDVAEPKLGTGARFAALQQSLTKKKGVSNPGALAAWIGRRKYGAHKMAQMAAKNRGK